MDLPLHSREIRSKIRMGEAVNIFGLTFYPITMLHYDEFLLCRDSLTVRMSSLPSKYISYNYLNAIWIMETDAVKYSGIKLGIFERLIKFLSLSLQTDINIGDLLSENITFKKKHDIYLIESFQITQNGKKVIISSSDFSWQIRPLLALQNGLILPKETENADIIRAEQIKKSLNTAENGIIYDIENHVSSVAYNSNMREKEIWNLTVREFNSMDRAIERDKRYMIFAQAELSGMVTFKKGNPFPSWRFETAEDCPGARSISEIGKIFNAK